MIAIPEHVLKYAPWSVSKAGTIEKCSLQFDYKYVQKLKELEENAEARLGVAVHSALEYTLGPKGTPAATAVQQSKDFHVLTADEADQLDSFLPNIEKFAERIKTFKEKNKVTQQLLETKWAIKADFAAAQFFDNTSFFRGVVDFGMLTDKGYLIIIDHKSGKVKPMSFYNTQFRSYAVMAAAHLPHIKGVQTAVHFVADGDLVWNDYVTKEKIIRDYRPYLVDEIVKSAAKLTEEVKPNEGWWCKWCGYKSICPAKTKSGKTSGENG